MSIAPVSCHASKVASARPPWPVAALRPLAMKCTIPGGSRLATDQGGRADATLLA